MRNYETWGRASNIIKFRKAHAQRSGTLTQFMGLRKINTHGIAIANKCMLAAAMAYNLKKYLKFTENSAKTVAQRAEKQLLNLFVQIRRILSLNPGLTF